MWQCDKCKCWYGDKEHVCKPDPMIRAAEILEKKADEAQKEASVYESNTSSDAKTVEFVYSVLEINYHTIAKALRGEE
jgi:hypothetical protein